MIEGITKDGEIVPLSNNLGLRGRVLQVGWDLPADLSEDEWRSLRNAVEYMPENEVLILYGGNGAREKAVQWLKKEASKIIVKRIHVVNINEFLQWVRRELVYDARKDFAGSLEDGYAAIRQRVKSGGPGWEPSR